MDEIPERIERHMTPEQSLAAEELVDKRGISIDMAERAILGARVEPAGPVAAPRVPHVPHSSGHVRDFESDRDYQLAEERANYQPPDPEQPAINARGRAAVEAALDEAFGKDRIIKAIEAEVHRLIPIDPDNVAKSEADRERLINARLRTHFEQKS